MQVRAGFQHVKSVAVGHFHIQKNKLRAFALQKGYGLPDVGGFAHQAYLRAIFAEVSAQGGAGGGFVFYNDASDFHRCISSGFPRRRPAPARFFRLG